MTAATAAAGSWGVEGAEEEVEEVFNLLLRLAAPASTGGKPEPLLPNWNIEIETQSGMVNIESEIQHSLIPVTKFNLSFRCLDL